VVSNLGLGSTHVRQFQHFHYEGGVSHVFKEEGVFALYRGLTPILLGAVPKAGIRFGSNTFFNEKIKVGASWESFNEISF
jgi:hypothetical protein